MNIFQEENVKDIQVGHPHVLKDKLVEKTGLVEGRFLVETQKKKKFMPLKEEADNSKDLQGCCGDMQGQHYKSQNATRT